VRAHLYAYALASTNTVQEQIKDIIILQTLTHSLTHASRFSVGRCSGEGCMYYECMHVCVRIFSGRTKASPCDLMSRQKGPTWTWAQWPHFTFTAFSALPRQWPAWDPTIIMKTEFLKWGSNRQLVSIGQGRCQEDEDACESFHCDARIAARSLP
jgi:hypothetical protein